MTRTESICEGHTVHNNLFWTYCPITCEGHTVLFKTGWFISESVKTHQVYALTLVFFMVQLFAMAASFFGSSKHSGEKSQNDDGDEFHSTQSSATGTPVKTQIKATMLSYN